MGSDGAWIRMKALDFRGNRRIGTAAEHRVISELLLRGFNPYIVVLDEGIDLMLENGKRIQIKSAHLQKQPTRGYVYGRYIFNSRKRYYEKARFPWDRLPKVREHVDFVICWGINDDVFYIIPATEIPPTGVTAHSPKEVAKNGRPRIYDRYINAWDLLRIDG